MVNRSQKFCQFFIDNNRSLKKMVDSASSLYCVKTGCWKNKQYWKFYIH